MEAFWAAVVRMSNGVGEKMIIQTVFFLLVIAGRWLIKWWTQRKYGLRVVVRMCWVENSVTRGWILKDEYIVGGNSLEILGSKKLAKQLITAAKKTKEQDMIKGPAWSFDQANQVLKEIDNRVSAKFCDGTLARALKDEGVTVGEFTSAAFVRSKNEVSVILVQANDMYAVAQPEAGKNIRGDSEELTEIVGLFAHLQFTKLFVFTTELAR